MAGAWRVEGNFQELFLFFPHVGFRFQTQVVRHGSLEPYLLSQLTLFFETRFLSEPGTHQCRKTN